MKPEKKLQRRLRRHKRTRRFVSGTKGKPRVSVFRSNKHIYAQLIDDEDKTTLSAASDYDIKSKSKPAEVAREVGKILGERAKEKKVKNVVFDRSGYKYHGRVKSLAEGLREAGLGF